MIKKFLEFIKEESDYRNVTGFGSMGSGDPQNAGPSFNKGPDSAIYQRPSVIGVASDDISDPYFAVRQQQKRKRVKKNQWIEKNRKDKTKYLRNIDKDTQNKVLEASYSNLDEKKDKLEKIKKILPSAYLYPISGPDENGNVQIWDICGDAKEFSQVNGSVFSDGSFKSIEDFKKCLDKLEKIGAENIRVGGIRYGWGILDANYLYFDNVHRDYLLPIPDENYDGCMSPWFKIPAEDEQSAPDDLEHFNLPPKTKISKEHDPYGEEEWMDVKPHNQWRAWWD
jgi:hypothetical protein